MHTKTKQQVLLAAVFFLTTLAALAQEPGEKANQTDAAPSRIPGSKNLQDAVEKMAHTVSVDTSPANRDPADIKPEAKELKDIGQDLFFRKNRPQEGIEKIEAAIKIDPRMPDAYNTLWSYYGVAKHDFQTAKRYLEAGAKHCPKSSSVRFDLGTLYSAMNRPKDAVEQFQIALDLGIESKAPVFYNIGNQYHKQGNLSAAIVSWKNALATDEKHLNARRNLAIAYVQSGDLKAARKEMQRLVDLDPNGDKGAWAREGLQTIQP